MGARRLKFWIRAAPGRALRSHNDLSSNSRLSSCDYQNCNQITCRRRKSDIELYFANAEIVLMSVGGQQITHGKHLPGNTLPPEAWCCCWKASTQIRCQTAIAAAWTEHTYHTLIMLHAKELAPALPCPQVIYVPEFSSQVTLHGAQ